jgi:uncharacterized Zn finger protein
MACSRNLRKSFYCVAGRLDTDPQLLFTLRGVDHTELISQAVAAENLERSLSAGQTDALGESNLEEVFGIEIDRGERPADPVTRKPPRSGKPAAAPKSTKRLPAKSRIGKKKPTIKNATLTKSRKKRLSGKRAGRRKTTAPGRTTSRKARQPA